MTDPAPSHLSAGRRELLVGGCVAGGLLVALFGAIIFGDRNFSFRDAGHFYYPYYRWMAQHWQAGGFPMWNPNENGGAPLVGNPTSCVFYPLRLLFLLPYAFAFKWHHLLHVILAWAAGYVAGRCFRLGSLASSLVGLSYAFSGFVLFQVYNIVFLVGAAWLPIALAAGDRVVRTGSLGWALVLAASLALQVLGGDPQAAYLVGVFLTPYWLYWHLGRWPATATGLGLLGVGYGIVHVGRLLAQTELRSWQWLLTSQPIAVGSMAALSAVGLVLLWIGLAGLRINPTALRSAQMAVIAGVLAGLLSAVQVLPTQDFTKQSDRAAPESPHETMPFSLFPARVIELAFPTFFGRWYPANTRWAPFQSIETSIWVPSLYLGLIPLAFAGLGLRSRIDDARRRWLIGLLFVSFWLAIGKFGGPRWLIDPKANEHVDPVYAERSAKLAGVSDGLYLIAEETLPGFHSFRYPSKLFVFTTLCLSLLAGMGLQEWIEGRQQCPTRVIIGAAGLTALLLLILMAGREFWIERWRGLPIAGNDFGPYLPIEAFRHLTWSLGQSCLVLSAFAFIIRLRRPSRLRLAGWLLGLTAVDLYFADGWQIISEAQASIDAPPKVMEAITADRQAAGEDQPFRLHRVRIFHPMRWKFESSSERINEMTRWERDTLQPKYGMPADVHYAEAHGTMSLYDIEFFFGPWVVKTPLPLRQKNPSLPADMVYVPRQGFNLWNAQYFVLPRAVVLDHEDRGVYTLLANANGEECPRIAGSSQEEDDYQVLKNSEALPRAWIVHEADLREPIRSLRRQDRLQPMEQLLFRPYDCGFPLWQSDTHRAPYPIRDVAMIETDQPDALAPFRSRIRTTPNESVRFESYQPNEIRLRAKLDAPGFVVMSETFYPGWSATVDGQPAPIHRANRAMRAIGVPAGEHVIVMTFRDRSMFIGGAISLVAWLGVLPLLAFRCWQPPNTVASTKSNASTIG